MVLPPFVHCWFCYKYRRLSALGLQSCNTVLRPNRDEALLSMVQAVLSMVQAVLSMVQAVLYCQWSKLYCLWSKLYCQWPKPVLVCWKVVFSKSHRYRTGREVAQWSVRQNSNPKALSLWVNSGADLFLPDRNGQWYQHLLTSLPFFMRAIPKCLIWDYVCMIYVDVMCMFCISPEVTLCSWRGYKPPRNKLV